MHDECWTKVRLPRRIQADTTDSIVALVIIYLPVFLADALAGSIPSGLARLSILGLPSGLLYMSLRDWVGRGTSPGKRLSGIALIRVDSGKLVRGSDVWKRNLLDIVPVFNTIDFIAACIDRCGQKFMDKRLGSRLVYATELLARESEERLHM